MTGPRGPSFVGRLLAEFSVIVLGVFVALAVDGWVERRADQADERQSLEALRADLALSAEGLREVGGEVSTQVERLDWLLGFPIDRSSEFPVDSLQAIHRAGNDPSRRA